MRKPPDECIRLARSIRLLGERVDLPCSLVQTTKDGIGNDAVQVEWTYGNRNVQVLVSCAEVKIVCVRAGARPCWVDSRRNFVEVFRRALAWMMGERTTPFGD